MLPRLISAPVALTPQSPDCSTQLQHLHVSVLPDSDVSCSLRSVLVSSQLAGALEGGSGGAERHVFLGIFPATMLPLDTEAAFSVFFSIMCVWYIFFHILIHLHFIFCCVTYTFPDGFVKAPMIVILESLSDSFSPWVRAWWPLPVFSAFGGGGAGVQGHSMLKASLNCKRTNGK